MYILLFLHIYILLFLHIYILLFVIIHTLLFLHIYILSFFIYLDSFISVSLSFVTSLVSKVDIKVKRIIKKKYDGIFVNIQISTLDDPLKNIFDENIYYHPLLDCGS